MHRVRQSTRTKPKVVVQLDFLSQLLNPHNPENIVYDRLRLELENIRYLITRINFHLPIQPEIRTIAEKELNELLDLCGNLLSQKSDKITWGYNPYVNVTMSDDTQDIKAHYIAATTRLSVLLSANRQTLDNGPIVDEILNTKLLIHQNIINLL